MYFAFVLPSFCLKHWFFDFDVFWCALLILYLFVFCCVVFITLFFWFFGILSKPLSAWSEQIEANQ